MLYADVIMVSLGGDVANEIASGAIVGYATGLYELTRLSSLFVGIWDRSDNGTCRTRSTVNSPGFLCSCVHLDRRGGGRGHSTIATLQRAQEL